MLRKYKYQEFFFINYNVKFIGGGVNFEILKKIVLGFFFVIFLNSGQDERRGNQSKKIEIYFYFRDYKIFVKCFFYFVCVLSLN